MGRRDQEINKEREVFERELLFERKLLEYIGSERGAQAALAKKLGLKRDHFNKMIHGERKMPFAILRAFCNALDLDPVRTQDLFALTGFHLVNPQTDSSSLPKQEFGTPHPKILLAYLQYVIDKYEWNMLPDGRMILMEQIYAALRANELNIFERMGEQTLNLEDVVALQQAMQASTTDIYATFAAIHKVINQYPKMLLFDVQNRSRLFAQQNQQLPLLAKVVGQHPSVVILGDPGSGKTMFGHWLILQFARALERNDPHVYVHSGLLQSGEKTAEEAKKIDLGPVRLPVFMSIADYARARWTKKHTDSGLTLLDFLKLGRHVDQPPNGFSREDIGDLVGAVVRQGKALLVLDGLDEVGDPQLRSIIIKAVQDFLQEHCALETSRDLASNKVVVTSRVVGYQYESLKQLPHYTVEEMDEQAITAFCYAWVRQIANSPVTGAERSEEAEQLRNTIFSQTHPGVRAMAGNPLLLTLIAQVYWHNQSARGSHAIPVRRGMLFDEAIRTFYDHRETFWDQAGITPLRLTRALGAVAAPLHAGKTGFDTEAGVRRHLQSVLTDKKQVEAVLAAARESSGLLVARGNGIYGFLHRAIQEYLAAQHLVSQSEQVIDNVISHAFDPTWREPVVLAVGIVSRPWHPEHDKLQNLFRALLDLPDPAGAFLPRRELLAVVACAECEDIPAEAGKRIAENLLAFYVKSKGSARSQLLNEPILRAFTSLQHTFAAVETEGVLCSAMGANDVERRSGAIDLVMRIKWHSPAIVRSLIEAWYMYLSPAELFLMAIENIYKHSPHYLQNESSDLLLSLLPTLIGEDVNTAYAVTHLLSTLVSTNVSVLVPVREQIIEALVGALDDPGSQREVVIAGENKGTIKDALSTVLLQVTGWAK